MSRVPRIAFAQDGVFTRRQAARDGMPYARIRRLIDRGEWRHVLGSCFVDDQVLIGPRQRARALMLETKGVVSHGSAAAIHRLGWDSGAHVTIDPSRWLKRDDITIHQLILDDDDVEHHAGILVTSRVRTVIDLLASAPPESALSMYYRTVQNTVLDREDLAGAVRRRTGWEGTPQLLRLLTESVPGAHSWLEGRLILDLEHTGFRGYETNVAIRDRDGFIGFVDVLFRREKLVIEVDGRAYHGDDRFQADRTRQNRLIRAGYTVLRFTYDDITGRPDEVMTTIRSTLARLAS